MPQRIYDMRIALKRDTTENWNHSSNFIPLLGEVVIYTDYQTLSDGITIIPGIKIGNGQSYVSDLPFVDSKLREEILSHTTNTDIHVTAQQKIEWSNKLNYEPTVLNAGVLEFNRN